MYFDKSFTLKRHNYKTFSDFMAIVKYYLRQYKKDNDIDITIDRDNFSIVFTGKNNVCFY